MIQQSLAAPSFLVLGLPARPELLPGVLEGPSQGLANLRNGFQLLLRRGKCEYMATIVVWDEVSCFNVCLIWSGLGDERIRFETSKFANPCRLGGSIGSGVRTYLGARGPYYSVLNLNFRRNIQAGVKVFLG